MAYELFDELSTCNLDEIEKEDIEKIIRDLEGELYRRRDIQCEKAIENFREALSKLEVLGVRVFYDCSDYDYNGGDLTCVPLYDGYNLSFDY